jgi:hypothetical protein
MRLACNLHLKVNKLNFLWLPIILRLKAYFHASGPVKGDLKMTIRKTNDTLSRNYPIGATANSISFSNEWWNKGVNRLDMEKHLEARAFDVGEEH